MDQKSTKVFQCVLNIQRWTKPLKKWWLMSAMRLINWDVRHEMTYSGVTKMSVVTDKNIVLCLVYICCHLDVVQAIVDMSTSKVTFSSPTGWRTFLSTKDFRRVCGAVLRLFSAILLLRIMTVLTSDMRVMRSVAFMCVRLFVCKITWTVMDEFSGSIAHVTETKWLNYCDPPSSHTWWDKLAAK